MFFVCSSSLCVLHSACFSSTPSFSGMWLQPSRYCVKYSTLPRREVGIVHGLGSVPMRAVWSCKLATLSTTTCKPITASLSTISIMIIGEWSEMSRFGHFINGCRLYRCDSHYFSLVSEEPHIGKWFLKSASENYRISFVSPWFLNLFLFTNNGGGFLSQRRCFGITLIIDCWRISH